MDNEYQYLFLKSQKILKCHVLNLNEWMKNDTNMTLWL